ncbi:HD-GYP domain-containing protein [Sporomusa acidovorans]|uniref:HD-GYP domain-containing protein n=1 Tax=Sporomusa acidovorans (strain ATCC 49682 / DSM 3132 / Mol) TaxID=1123286 RepID=A0ABZ3JAQ8_SPOA4|nr:HD domain-containing phosphohydrolase [Sporomusa acidovorans]OZC22934.1 cyclic di-GMP phosphodiesterase response regulator RpfG [Sporomusa acidovorans DSM 3132]SDE94802.1 HD domain-containing protein [Sporomusa acidovorans]
MLISEITAGMVLTQDIVDDNGNLLLEQGIALTEQYISRLKQLGITNIPVFDSCAVSLKNHTVIMPELRSDLTNCFRSLYDKKTQSIIHAGLHSLAIQKIRYTIGQVIDETEKNLGEIVNIQVRQPGQDEVAHAVNVCLMVVATGLYMRLPRPVLMDLAQGALFPDLGKLVLPAPDGPAAYPEHLHPIYGQQLLLKNKLGTLVARIAAEHHERYDGEGYPAGLAGREIHPLSRLVTIANYFDNNIACISKSGGSRNTVMETMLANGNTMFDMYLLRAFFHTTPLYSVGCFVRLNTNQKAYVIKNRVHFAATPTVHVTTKGPRRDCPAINQIVDLAIKPQLFIINVIAE